MDIHRLDGVILTHTDNDHAGGAAALAQSSIAVDAWYAPDFHVCKTKKHPLVLASALRNETVTWLRAGDTLPLDGGTLTVLAPVVISVTENCNSLVLLAESPDGSILLTGDMEHEEEATIMDQLTPVTVLKVANHGESDATSWDLVDRTRPQLAIISTDSAEEPDTPSGRVLSNLKKANVPMLCTQNSVDGILVTLSDGIATAEMLDLHLPEPRHDVVIADKSVAQDTVTLTNWGTDPAALGGWYLVSDRGNEVFLFPDGTELAPGGSLTISSLASEDAGDFIWPEKRVWHQSKDDTAMLYNAQGKLVDQLD